MRISKVTTKTGDKGETGLGDGQRVSKDHPAIVFLGELDELNSHLGLAIASSDVSEWNRSLSKIQQDLFNIGGEASMPDDNVSLLDESRVSSLETELEKMNKDLPPLAEFILPGGDDLCARLHVARAICRRAERSCVSLMHKGTDVKFWLKYLNRLSDYLFVLVRYINQKNDGHEALWSHEK